MAHPAWDKLVDERVRALHEAADGRLWVCTGAALEVWDGFQFAQHRRLTRPGGDKYRAVTSDRKGVVWMGGESGLMRWQDDQWRQFTTADGLPDNDVYVISEDHAGRFWIGTLGGGVSWLGESRFEAATKSAATNLCRLTINTTHGLSHNEVRALHEDGDGFLWVGTERGLNRIDLRDVAATPSSQTRPSDEASPPRTPPVHSFTRRNGLYDDLVSEILEDDLGNLWISCSRGIYRVRKQALDDVANGHAAQIHCVVYDEAEGLLSTDISGQKSRPAGCKTPDGRLWFPNAKGVVTVDPRRVIESDIPPPVVIERFLVDGEDCAGKDFTPLENTFDLPRSSNPLALAPGRARSLEIQFTASTFRSPERVRFRYRLEGWEPNWVDAGTRRVALYTNLRPGKYRFQVQAASNVGLWNETGDALAFSIAPHVYETAWFWPAMIVLGLGLVGVAVEWRLREVRRIDELSKLAALASERDRIARDMHDDLGAGLTRLVLLGDKASSRSADAETRTAIQRLTGEADTLVDQLSDLIWCSNPDYDSLDNLLAHLREHAGKFLSDAGLAVSFEQPGDAPTLPVTGFFRRQVLLMFKEVLTNIARHARATDVVIHVAFPHPCHDGGAGLELVIVDNGCGFAAEKPSLTRGHGLGNLRSRATALQGRVEIESAPGQGTVTRITLPLKPHLAEPRAKESGKATEKAGE